MKIMKENPPGASEVTGRWESKHKENRLRRNERNDSLPGRREKTRQNYPFSVTTDAQCCRSNTFMRGWKEQLNTVILNSRC